MKKVVVFVSWYKAETISNMLKLCSRRKHKKRLSEEEVLPGMEKGAQKQEIQIMNVGRRLVRKNFLFGQRIQLAASTKQAGGANGKGRDEAAAAENGERSDKENLIKKEEWTLRTDGGSRSCGGRL